MRPELARVLQAHGGVARRADLLASVPVHLIDRAVSRGQLVRVLPQVYCDPELLDAPLTRLRSALEYAGKNAALSHTSGLPLWNLPVPADLPVHLTTGTRRLLPAGDVIVHRRRGFRAEPPLVVSRGGLAVVRLENCLVDSWPLLAGYERRAPLISAVQQRLTTADRVLMAAEDAPRLPGRASLLRLADLLASGCHSELEIWGFRHVFTHPMLPTAQQQLRVRLGSRVTYLDVAYAEEMVDVELDGSRYHFGDDQREQDMRRDAALVAAGWLVVRFSHRRLHQEPDAVRREVLATLEVRRRQLRIA